jgi:hypothetical protein
VYVYYGAGQAFYYYAARYALPMQQVTMGRCSVGNPRGYLRQLDQLRGRDRVWIVGSHAVRQGGELIVMLAYLNTIGRRVDAMPIPGTTGRTVEAAYLYLYDLSDPERLRAATSEDFPIPEGSASAPPGPFACYGVSLPDKR